MTYNRDNKTSFKSKQTNTQMNAKQQQEDREFQFKNYSLTYLKELIHMNKLKNVDSVDALIKEAKKLEEYVKPKESRIKTL